MIAIAQHPGRKHPARKHDPSAREAPESMMRDNKGLEQYIITVLAVLLLLFVAGSWRAQSEEPKATTGEAQPERLRAITPQEALVLVQRNKENPSFVILDVRTPEEFKSGYIEGATNIDYYGPGFPVEIGKLDRTKTYLVYCRTGNRTESTFALMKELQFKEVYPVEGGITAWRAAGFPVTGQKRP